MGVDGAGKTTLINLLKKKLKKKFTRIRYVHLRPYLFIFDKRNTIDDPYKNKKKEFKLISFLRIIYWLIVYKIYFIYLKSNKKELILFDRYADELMLDKLRYEFNLSNNLSKFILNLFPQPNFWIYVVAPVKVIQKRKQELNNDKIRTQLIIYRNFFKSKKNFIQIHTNKDENKNITLIINKIRNISI